MTEKEPVHLDSVERVATIACWSAPAYLAGALLAYLLTGGSEWEIFGTRVSLHSLHKPMLVALAVFSGGMLISRDRLVRATAWVEGQSRKSLQWAVWSGAVIACLVLCVVKLWQHYAFQTSAYDLGIQASVAWNTAHGRLFHDSVQDMNYLGDHFSPIYLFFALAYRLWDSPALLLVIQSAGFGLAAVAVWRLGERHLKSNCLVLLMFTLFLLNPFLHRVSAFDFHPVALAVPLFLWLLDFLERRRFGPVVLLSVLAASVEETLLPPLVGIGLYAASSDERLRPLGLSLSLLAGLLFALELGVLMPFFLGENRLTHISRYGNLGGQGVGEIGMAVLRDPLILVREMMTPAGKIGALASLMQSVGWLPLLAPAELLLLVIPVVSIQLSSYPAQWTFDFQYSATILPFLFFSAIHGLARLEGFVTRRVVGPGKLPYGAFIKMAALVWAVLIAHAVHASPRYVSPWSPRHVAAMHALVREVPPGASVCALASLVPHLVHREQVSMLRPAADGRPELDDAEFLLIDRVADGAAIWPFSQEGYRAALASVLEGGEYGLLRERDGALLLRRRGS